MMRSRFVKVFSIRVRLWILKYCWLSFFLCWKIWRCFSTVVKS